MTALNQPLRLQMIQIFANGDLGNIQCAGEFANQDPAMLLDQRQNVLPPFIDQHLAVVMQLGCTRSSLLFHRSTFNRHLVMWRKRPERSARHGTKQAIPYESIRPQGHAGCQCGEMILGDYLKSRSSIFLTTQLQGYLTHPFDLTAYR